MSDYSRWSVDGSPGAYNVDRTVAVDEESSDDRAASSADRMMERLEDHLGGRPVLSWNRSASCTSTRLPRLRHASTLHNT